MTPVDQKTLEQLMRSQNFSGAIEFIDTLLARDGDEPDCLYFRAVCLRYLGNIDLALQVLHQLKMRSPGYSRAFQEEGHCFKKLGQFDQALSAYAKACQLNPALHASYNAQIEILRSQSRFDQANAVQAQLHYLQQQPKALQGVLDLMSQGKWLKAEKLCRQFLQRYPKHVEAMRLLAEVGVQLGVLDDAEFLLESALIFEPDNFLVHRDSIQVLRKRQKFAKALEQAKTLWEKFSDNPQAQSIYAIEFMQTGDYQKAIDLFDQVLTTLPNEPITLTSKGHALKTWGRTESAIESYRQALAVKPAHGEAWYALANLKTVQFSGDDIDQMLMQLQSGDLGPAELVYVYFALGKAFEDNKDFEKSFYYYEQGNTLKKLQSRYQADQITEEFQQQKLVFTNEFIQSRKGYGCLKPDPIFIVGLPRAGSTLLEQILASHSQVDGTLELPNILSLVHRIRRGESRDGGNHYPHAITHLSPEQLTEFGEEYLRDTQIHRQGAAYFIDKMPNNFRHIGLIKLILPNAKIIDAGREPMACCFSGFKQLFAEGQEFSYSLKDIGQYYRDYEDLMAFWQAQFPGEILQVNYEEVVDDFENQVRRLLNYCGLEFEQSCLDFYKNKRAVRTASSEQVRQPIYKSGVDQWRHYEPFLQPLKELLNYR